MPRLRTVLERSGFAAPDFLVVTNLQYAELDRIAKPRRLVYRCVDDVRGFQSAPRALARAEEDLLRRCDFCFATSESLAEKLRARGARHVDVIRHGVDLERFFSADSQVEPLDLVAIPRPRVIYVGTLSEWFNAEWLEAAARTLPQSQFVLIGSRERSAPVLPNGRNVHVLGPRPPEMIPAYLQACQAAVIPFRVSPLVESVLPVKLYEYLAAGLPVVATRWRELERLDAPITLAGNVAEFIAGLRRAVAPAAGSASSADTAQEAPANAPAPPEARAERVAFARANSWEQQFDRMIDIIRGENAPRP